MINRKKVVKLTLYSPGFVCSCEVKSEGYKKRDLKEALRVEFRKRLFKEGKCV